jgi:hypothetical protein
MAKYTAEQLANIQIDYGIVYIDYGLASERLLGPTRGGATFEATQQIRDIEFDGRNGKTKGMQHIDFIDAVLKLTSLAISNDDLEVAIELTLPDLVPDTLTLIKSFLSDQFIDQSIMFFHNQWLAAGKVYLIQ